MPSKLLSLALALSLLPASLVLRAEELPSLEDAAARAQACVATVRILDRVAEPATETEDAKPARPRVTVCTGVCVEKGWIVTPAFAGSDSQIRLTLPGGQQSQGQVRVIDEYSGLALIEADTHALKVMQPAAAAVKVGAWVLSAAAWGVEPPVISLGILGGQDRTVGGMQYPPLLQADLRTTETSGGAALVNRAGELLGIVVLVDDGKDRRGWTYAVPASHVGRLLRARVERRALDKPMKPDGGAAEARVNTSVVVLKRRRPVVGMVLDGIGESVVVLRIEKGSPAEKAGLKKGDVVQAVDGIKIRSVYQAVTPILYKQPGDLVEYEVQQGGISRKVEVALGGGVELPTAPLEVLGEYVRPKVDIEATAAKRYIAKSGRDEVREVFAPGDNEDTRSAEQRLQAPSEQVKLLEKALERYRTVIVYQQGQLGQRESERRATEERIGQLEKELDALKTQMKESK
jgi:serine protease Do